MATRPNLHEVLPQSKPAVVISIPKPAPKAITQEEIVELIYLRNILKQKEALVARIESGLKERLEAGAEIEHGVHTAEPKESFRRNVAWREVSVRLAERLYGENQGEGYCERVLSSTKPTRTVSLQLN